MTDQTTDLITIAPAAITGRPNLLDTTILELIKALAPSFHACRWYGLTSPEQAIVVMTKAVELGLPFTAAFDFIDVIEGRPSLKPIGALALIHRNGRFDVKIDDSTPDRCTVWMRRRDTGFEHTVTYTVDDAKAAGLIKPGKDGAAWSRFLTDMLRNRAVGRCARIVAPDVLAGLYLTTDLQHDVPADVVVDGETGEILRGQP